MATSSEMNILDTDVYFAQPGFIAESVKRNVCPADDGWLSPGWCSGELVPAIMVAQSNDPDVRVCLKCGSKWTLTQQQA